MSAQAHLEAIYAAQLKLGHLGAQIGACTRTMPDFDALLIAAVGESPSLAAARDAAEASVMLRDALADALRLCDRIDDLLTDYRKGI